MSARKPVGFTLVELLVVIVIISMLIGLLIPGVMMAREAARRNSCMNNQHEIAAALAQYETATERLPGYSSVWPAGGTRELSWMAMLTPYLGMNDVWKELRPATGSPSVTSSDRRFLCPSDTEKRDSRTYPLSYVGNCGWTDGTDVFQPIFTGSGSTVKIKTDAIPDGASNTLMFSENVNATQWFPMSLAAVARVPLIVDVGMVWHRQALAWKAINQGMDTAPTFPATDPITTADWVAYLPYARPSSYHSGGVVATFCDGHSEFITDDAFVGDGTNPTVFQQRMSPNDAQAKGTTLKNPALMP